jgi:hypothetical protein
MLLLLQQKEFILNLKNMKKTKILVIEDEALIQFAIEMSLPSDVELVQAFTLAEAEEKFATEEDITHIFVDFDLYKKTTELLVIEIRKIFSGLIIAISSDDDSNRILKKAGCNYSVKKGAVAEHILELLKENLEKN